MEWDLLWHALHVENCIDRGIVCNGVEKGGDAMDTDMCRGCQGWACLARQILENTEWYEAVQVTSREEFDISAIRTLIKAQLTLAVAREKGFLGKGEECSEDVFVGEV